MFINEVTLYGNLTRDPELKSLPSGVKVANLSIATNEYYKDKDGNKQEKTEYHNLIVFGKTAETIAQYCVKGKPLYIKGTLQTRNWEKDGVKQYRTEILVNSFQFGPSPKTDEPKKQSHDDYDDIGVVEPKDIPF